MMTGTYTIQATRAAFNQSSSSVCLLCKEGYEDITHFLLTCKALGTTREPLLQKIIYTIPLVYPDHPSSWSNADLTQLVLDATVSPPGHSTPELSRRMTKDFEHSTRQLCYALHIQRVKILQVQCH